MPKKDPNAPKRPLSAYFKWLGENRARVKAENTSLPHKEVTSKLGEMWNALADSEKKVYKDEATEEMNKWKEAFNEYKKTDDYKNWQAQKAAEAGSSKKGKGRKKKAPKDPNAPKRPSTGFFLFVAEKREEVKASLPAEDQNKVTVVTKRCGQMWKNASEEEQAKYKDRSKALKEKYDEDLAAYKQTQNYRDYQEILKEFKEKQKAQERKQNSRGRTKSRKMQVLDDSDTDGESESESS